YSLWWVPVYIFGKFVMDDRAITRFSLFLGGGSLIALIFIFVAYGLLGDWRAITLMGTVSWVSLLLMVLSGLGPLGSMVALWKSTQMSSDHKGVKYYGVIASIVLLITWGYIALQGWVPLVTFRA
ncbi:MAG: hypothetical protein AAF723_11225, partial [Pseudomonadota bacterium]